MEGIEPPSGMIMRWFDTLSNFNDVLIEHRPGKKHANADALSRCAHAEEPDPDDEPDEMICGGRKAYYCSATCLHVDLQPLPKELV
jgi:hypothetical protein